MTAVPEHDRQLTDAAALRHTFTAMASQVTVEVLDPSPQAAAAVAAVERLFADVQRTCTRFDPSSDLMLANTAATRWQSVDPLCAAALREAARAHEETDGGFDPRVLRSLQALGYDRTLSFADGVDLATGGPGPTPVPVPARGRWALAVDPGSGSVRIGPDPVDLGGIGKGLSVRWAAQLLAEAGRAVLVEAGGDCFLGGTGPVGDGWQVGVENPAGGDRPLAVLSVSDLGVATSSVRIRSWRVDGRTVHHLIDPRTGQPGGIGLAAVTVVHPDPAWAEVWSKVLFLAGRSGVRQLAEREQLAAYWVTEQGRTGHTARMKDHVIWQDLDD